MFLEKLVAQQDLVVERDQLLRPVKEHLVSLTESLHVHAVVMGVFLHRLDAPQVGLLAHCQELADDAVLPVYLGVRHPADRFQAGKDIERDVHPFRVRCKPGLKSEVQRLG